MTPPEIRVTIEELLHATRPEQRSAYERALLAIAVLVAQTTAAIDGYTLIRMSREQIALIDALRAAIPRSFPLLQSTEGIP